MPREIHTDVNAGYSLVECLREIEERRAKIIITSNNSILEKMEGVEKC